MDINDMKTMSDPNDMEEARKILASEGIPASVFSNKSYTPFTNPLLDAPSPLRRFDLEHYAVKILPKTRNKLKEIAGDGFDETVPSILTVPIITTNSILDKPSVFMDENILRAHIDTKDSTIEKEKEPIVENPKVREAIDADTANPLIDEFRFEKDVMENSFVDNVIYDNESAASQNYPMDNFTEGSSSKTTSERSYFNEKPAELETDHMSSFMKLQERLREQVERKQSPERAKILPKPQKSKEKTTRIGSNQIVAELDIKISKNKNASIKIHENDKPKTVAENFGKIYALRPTQIAELELQIANKIFDYLKRKNNKSFGKISKPASGKSSIGESTKESDRDVLFKLEIDVGHKKIPIIVRRGDDPKYLAQSFCDDNGIPAKAASKVEGLIRQSLTATLG